MRVENMSLECLFYPPDTALSQGLVLAVLLYIFITGGLACELNLLFRKRGLKRTGVPHRLLIQNIFFQVRL